MVGQATLTEVQTTAVTDRVAPWRRLSPACHFRIVVRVVAVLLGLLVGLAGVTGAAEAATIQVTTSTDENGTNPAACSLREALTAANTNAAFGGCPAGDPDGTATDRITFAAGTNGTPIVLGGAQLTISSSVEIVGNSATQTVISGNDASRVFNVSAGTSSISSLTIRNGRISGADGGGILVSSGALTMNDSALSSNAAVSDFFGGGFGGGIAGSGGTVIVTNSTLSGNTADAAGGIYANGGTVTVTNSTLSGNTALNGGGIGVSGGTVTIVHSTLSGNSSGSATGGVRTNGGTVRLRATIIQQGSGINCSGSGAIISLGSNLLSDGSCSAVLIAAGDQNNATLNLGTLDDNGGPTRTHALLTNSDAIDAVQGSCTDDGTPGGTPITADQRGVARPRNGTCDAGAFELASSITPGSIQFGAPTFSIGEAGPTASVTVTRTGGADGTISAAVSLADGTATAPADYDATTRTVSFAAGDAATKTVTIPIVDDALDEADENVNLSLGSLTSSLSGASLGAQSTATLTITDNDPTPTLSINDVTLAEGNAGATAFVFTVTLSAASGQTVTVQAQTADGTATAASGDYTAAGPTTLTFTPGQTQRTFTVQVTGDAVDEAAETFVVNLTSPSNATILDNQGQANITNDDGPPALSVSDPSVAEGDSGTATLAFTVSLGPASGQTVTVDFATADGTATGGATCTGSVDYQSTNGTLTFLAGETSKSVNVPVCGDLVPEATESVLLNLSNVSNATLADGQGQGSVLNDDGPGTVAFTASTVTVNENAGSLTLTVERAALQGAGNGSGSGNPGARRASSNPGAAALTAVTVQYATSDGAAQAGKDYTAVTGALSFGVNETSKTITVPIRDDSDTEPSETFTVTLSSPTGGATLGTPSTVTVTILDTTTPAPALQGQDDSDASRKNTNAKDGKDTSLTEEQQRQREHTNRGNRDDVATEGNVVEVHQDQTPPYIVIANRDGAVRVNLLCGGQCPIIQVGDYVEIDGEKQHESLYDATDVTVSR